MKKILLYISVKNALKIKSHRYNINMRLLITSLLFLYSSVAVSTDCTPILRDDGKYEISASCVDGYYKEKQKINIEEANKRWQSNLSTEQRKSLRKQFKKMEEEQEKRNLYERIRKLEKNAK